LLYGSIYLLESNEIMNKSSIKHAAELAGVSIASVSRALNNKPGLSEKTRARIIEVCKNLGYQPSEAARKLKIGRKHHVGLSLGNGDLAHGHYISTLFEALNQRLIKEGMVISLYASHELEKMVNESGTAILTGVVEGDARIKRLQALTIPFVCVGHVENCFTVTPNDELGGKLAAQHLVDLGCENSVIIESKLEGKGTKNRAFGFQSYMQSEGVIPGRIFIEERLAIELHTYRMITNLLNKKSFSFDSAFCETDEIAYGTLIACQDYGLKIPQDIKIIGFDNLPGVFDNITTLHQNLNLIADSITELLAEAKEPNSLFRHIVIPVDIFVRQSTK